MLQLHTLKPPQSKKHRRRLGRGIAAGRGKTAGRGTKGQKSRTGSKTRIVIPNLPKLKGFKSRHKKPVTINWLRVKDKFKTNEKIMIKKLVALELIKKGQRFKIVGRPIQEN